jgi:hypothetical protein
MSYKIDPQALQIPSGFTNERPANPSAGMLFFNKNKDDIEKWDTITGSWVTMTLKYYRYWRYRQISAITGHHPRASRIMIVNDRGQEFSIAGFTSDNCGDSGTIPSDGTSYVYDFGSSPQRIVSAWIYSTYAGGLRASNVAIECSNDNSNWQISFNGIAHNYTGGNYNNANTAAQCGPIEIFGATRR